MENNDSFEQCQLHVLMNAFFLRQLQRELRQLKERFNQGNPFIAVNPEKGRKVDTVLCRWMEILEVSILEILLNHLQSKGCLKQSYIPIHDGILIDKHSKVCLQSVSDKVHQETGFRYKYRLKPLKSNPESFFCLE